MSTELLAAAAAVVEPVHSNLSQQQHHVLSLLASGQSVAATARACGLHRSTIYHWQHENPDFARALRDTNHERTNHWHSVVDEHAAPAFTFIRATMDNDQAPLSQRLRAAFFLATQSLKPTPAPSKLELQHEHAERTRLQQGQETAAYYAKIEEEEAEAEEEGDSTDPTQFDTSTPDEQASDVLSIPTDPTHSDTSTPDTLLSDSYLYDEDEEDDIPTGYPIYPASLLEQKLVNEFLLAWRAHQNEEAAPPEHN